MIQEQMNESVRVQLITDKGTIVKQKRKGKVFDYFNINFLLMSPKDLRKLMKLIDKP